MMKVCKIICLLAKFKEQATQESLFRCLQMAVRSRPQRPRPAEGAAVPLGEESSTDNPTLTFTLKFHVYWEVEVSLIIVNDLELSMCELILQASHKI